MLFTVTACGAESSSVGLEALSIEDRSDAEGYHPARAGEILVAVRVRLLNAGAAPVPIDEGRFELARAEGSPLDADPLTAWMDGGCAGELPAGESVECVVAFALREGFEPTHAVFTADGERAEAALPARPPPGDGLRPTNQLDLLVMSDDSGSLTEEQASFTAELPRFIAVLASGDLDADGRADVPPFDVQAAVVSSDMGVGGFTVPTCAEPDFGDDGILETEGRTDVSGCEAEYPGFLEFSPDAGADPAVFARDLGCLTLDTGGCGFEQPLEAVLKAVSPSQPTIWTAPGYRPPAFFEDTPGHADGANEGFVRPDSVLAIVMLSDEDDCSASDPAIFDPSGDGPYAGTDLSLRCFAHADAALHALSRFVEGLLQLRRDPRRVVFAPIVGLPADLEPAPGATPHWDTLISEDPALRDDRLEERINPAQPSQLIPSCDLPGRGIAMPPVRILRAAHLLEARGARVALGSICRERYESAFDSLVFQIVAAARGAD